MPATWPVNTALLLPGLRSPATTPPVVLTSDQLSAATFATKLPPTSREMEKTVIELPELMFCAGTTVPLPSAAVSTRTCVAAPTVMLNGLLVAEVRPLLVACSV